MKTNTKQSLNTNEKIKMMLQKGEIILQAGKQKKQDLDSSIIALNVVSNSRLKSVYDKPEYEGTLEKIDMSAEATRKLQEASKIQTFKK